VYNGPGVTLLRRGSMRRAIGIAVVTLALAATGCSWTVRASVSGSGAQGNGGGIDPLLSGDGRYVVFQSNASNLVPGDANDLPDIFVRDNETGAVEMVSVASDGTQTNGNSFNPTIDEAGRYVVFHSLASNLVPGDANGVGDLFIHDRSTGTTDLIPAQPPVGQVPVLSGDGRYVAYRDQDGTNVYDRVTGTREIVPQSGTIEALSDDGRYIAIGRDNAPSFTAVLYDRQTSTVVEEISAVLGGGLPRALSGDGRYFVYDALIVVPPTSVHVEIRVLDRDTRTTQTVAVSSGFGSSAGEDISDDGRYVLYSTNDAHVPEDTNGIEDVYVRDLVANRTFLAARSATGAAAERGASNPDISDDGRYIAFHSLSANLVPADTNDEVDVFVRAFPQPEPRSATPSSVPRGTTTTISIEGEYLLPSSSVAVTGTGVSVDAVTWVSDHRLDATISVAPDAATGLRGVLVTIPGTGAGPDGGAVGGCGCLTLV
jgi:Tol biopolymer transport system component